MPLHPLAIRTLPKTRRIRPTLLDPKEGHVLPQRHILAIRIPQRLMDLRTMQPLYALDLARRVIHNGPPDFHRRGVMQLVERGRLAG